MTEYTRRSTLALAGAAGLGALAGCLDALGGEDHAGDGTLGNPAPNAEVRVLDMPNPAFDPPVVHVEPGATVRWVVEGRIHTVTSYHPDTYGPLRWPEDEEPFNSGFLRSNGEFEWTFASEGVYDYVDTRTLCAPHETLGAVGRVVVGWPDPDEEPACLHDETELSGRATQTMSELNEQTDAALRER
ncbi:plastocyanin/azurin family copper-binding protein [Halovivax gelatinilyticus]|uniref:plastocyanin/azurin family copper-binding protein n=1 Tax=Halovivax gelatinilyticus TaxID=2961597 RepID=UPI0020CA639E|nr:plastocyanin/azurin family copper-binding protein [Halovivax gelatinilyticus]